MLTYEDCLAMCDLTEDEIDAIAERAHLPEIVALELGQYIIERPDGDLAVRRIILEDIADAETRGDMEHALKLKLVLRHFIRTHPRHDPGNEPKAAQGGA